MTNVLHATHFSMQLRLNACIGLCLSHKALVVSAAGVEPSKYDIRPKLGRQWQACVAVFTVLIHLFADWAL